MGFMFCGKRSASVLRQTTDGRLEWFKKCCWCGLAVKHTHILTYALLLPFSLCETTLMGTLTGLNRRWRERRPAGLHHENHCVQKESISAFQCNSIHSQRAKKQLENGNATWLQVEEKEGGGGGRINPIHLRLLCVKVSLFQGGVVTHTPLWTVPNEAPAAMSAMWAMWMCVFALTGYLLKASSRCIPLAHFRYFLIYIFADS